MATRTVTRVAMACVALLFLTGALIFAHLAAWVWLRSAQGFSDLAAAGSLAGIDLLIAAVFLFCAARSTPSRTELEALELRRQAIQGIGSGPSLLELLIRLLSLASLMRRRSDD